MATTERSTVVGVFNDRNRAERAIDALKQAGFHDNQIGIATRDSGENEGTIRSTGEEHDTGGGAATGAISGGVVGGVLGALAAGLIPGVGPVLAGGILAGVLGGAAVGAAAGGIIGASTSMGVPEDEARYYDEEFKGGRTLVTVKADRRYDEARSILQSHGAYDIENRGMEQSSMPQPRPAVDRSDVTRSDVTAAPRSDRGGRRTVEGDSLELREEELTARKERTPAGKAEIEKNVVSERRSMDVPVAHEEVVIDRHPVDRRPSDRPVGDDEEIEMELSREEVIPEKRTVVYEEVGLDKRVVQDTERVEGDVRREVAQVKNTGDVRVQGESESRRSGGDFDTWDDARPFYRERWQTRYGSSGGRWEDAEPGYHYGYEMSRDPRYRNRNWQDVESDFGSDYSEWSRRGGYGSRSTWDKARDSAREAWEDARSHSSRR